MKDAELSRKQLREDADLADMGRPLKFQYQENGLVLPQAKRRVAFFMERLGSASVFVERFIGFRLHKLFYEYRNARNRPDSQLRRKLGYKSLEDDS